MIPSGTRAEAKIIKSPYTTRRQASAMRRNSGSPVNRIAPKIGPAIVLVHSQSGAFGWPVADARPDLVKAIVAVEPNGPPFFDVENVPPPDWFRYAATPARPWGITAVSLSYSPPSASASDTAAHCEA